MIEASTSNERRTAYVLMGVAIGDMVVLRNRLTPQPSTEDVAR